MLWCLVTKAMFLALLQLHGGEGETAQSFHRPHEWSPPLWRQTRKPMSAFCIASINGKFTASVCPASCHFNRNDSDLYIPTLHSSLHLQHMHEYGRLHVPRFTFGRPVMLQHVVSVLLIVNHNIHNSLKIEARHVFTRAETFLKRKQLHLHRLTQLTNKKMKLENLQPVPKMTLNTRIILELAALPRAESWLGTSAIFIWSTLLRKQARGKDEEMGGGGQG